MSEKEAVIIAKRRSQGVMIGRRFIHNKLAVVGLIILGTVILLAVFAGFFSSYADMIKHNYQDKLLPISAQHWFGTDEFGRDLFTRIIYGSRNSLAIGFIAVSCSLLLGGAIGAISGFFGGKLDIIVMRFIDMLQAIPSMLMAITIVSALGAGMTNLILAITIANIPSFALIVRSSMLTIKNSEFVEAARAGGCKTARIIIRHILPNAMGPIIVQATLSMGGVILTAASLSFIGLGVMPPDPEWGAILTNGQEYMRDYPNLVIFPGLTIMLTVLACNFLGDGLRDALDPKLKH